MIRRARFTADHADLLVLEDEARRRGISLAQVLRDVVAAEAGRLRGERERRTGVVSNAVGAGLASVEDEESPAATPFRP
jgi:hypothetical protein